MENEKKPSVNVRKALAGMELLKGKPLGEALVEAGYSKWTARAPSRNGISADQCLEEAKKLDPDLDPGNLLASARKLLKEKLESADPKTESLSAVSRMADVAEKWYGRGQDRFEEGQENTLEERLVFVAQLTAYMNTLKARPQAAEGGGPPPETENEEN